MINERMYPRLFLLRCQLRGAADAGVPGMIIEHGFHTVPDMRQKATAGELAEAWAEADADGLAEGYHLVKNTKTEEK